MTALGHAQFLSPEFLIRAATEQWERDAAFALRRRTFCEEQRLFDGDDRDALDDVATPLVAISTLAAEPYEVVGTVRIHEEAPGVWRGSRLAVAPGCRRVGRLGAELIRLAVCTATGRGCRLFLAHVQAQNRALFERLHWIAEAEVTLHGAPHVRMRADLAHYPPLADPTAGWSARLRR
jgi:putative N-acetyltransferase (TIGR04045 family)